MRLYHKLSLRLLLILEQGKVYNFTSAIISLLVNWGRVYLLDLYLEIDWSTIHIDDSFLGLSWDQVDERARLQIWDNLADPIDYRLIKVLCDYRALDALSTTHGYRLWFCFIYM